MVKALIFSSELPAAQELQRMTASCMDNIRILGISPTTGETRRAINSYEPDLGFIDLDLPKNQGFELLKSYSTPDFEIIFLSSDPVHAVKAIRYSPIDFLSKPVSPRALSEALAGAVKKIEAMRHAKAEIRKSTEPPGRISVPDATGYRFIDVQHILHVESAEYSSTIFLADKTKVSVNKSLREMEEILGDDFFRIHTSHIINLNHAVKYIKGNGGYIQLSNGDEMEVSRRRKEAVLNRMTSM